MKTNQQKKTMDKKGISLIVLVITIIVIIILAGTVILSLSQNNPIESANKATFLNDVEAFKTELVLYKTQKYGETLGQYNPEKLSANKDSITYNEENQTGDITDIIPSLGKKTQYLDEFEVQTGGLVYVGTDTNKKQWAEETGGIEVGDASPGGEEPSNGVSDPGYVATKGVNGPVLKTGMTPIKWDASGNVVTTTASDTDWYDYTNKKWANAQTADGSMWVWIPRYEYKIPTPHSSSAQTIAVNFLQGTQTTPTSGYTVHPAFIFGSTELTGIWVAKFEASGSTSAVDVKPNVSSLRTITIGDMFTASRNMETNNRYGWGTNGIGIDTHQMKNIEWGACVCLSSSTYGKSGEVWINPNSNYTTGQAGTGASVANTTSTYSYNNATYGINASTSGTVYGVYDMSGGAWEYTAAYVNNGNSNLTTYGGTLVAAGTDAKYRDVYTSSGDTMAGNYSAASGKKGDAVYETSTSSDSPYTSSWYSDYSYMPYSSLPFFVRGGGCSNATGAGVFAFDHNNGSAYSNIGFRPVLVVNSGV